MPEKHVRQGDILWQTTKANALFTKRYTKSGQKNLSSGATRHAHSKKAMRTRT
jgi:hypothetical protein